MISSENIPAKQRKLQEQIAAQTAAFLSAGGKIKTVEVQQGRDDKAKHGGFSINGALGNRLKPSTKAKKVQ